METGSCLDNYRRGKSLAPAGIRIAGLQLLTRRSINELSRLKTDNISVNY
jgi:hypothetical protein